MFRRIFGFVPRRNEWAEVRSGGEDESVDIVFLDIFYFFIPVEKGRSAFDLFDGDDVWLSEEALGVDKTVYSAERNQLVTLHY